MTMCSGEGGGGGVNVYAYQPGRRNPQRLNLVFFVVLLIFQKRSKMTIVKQMRMLTAATALHALCILYLVDL